MIGVNLYTLQGSGTNWMQKVLVDNDIPHDRKHFDDVKVTEINGVIVSTIRKPEKIWRSACLNHRIEGSRAPFNTPEKFVNYFRFMQLLNHGANSQGFKYVIIPVDANVDLLESRLARLCHHIKRHEPLDYTLTPVNETYRGGEFVELPKKYFDEIYKLPFINYLYGEDRS